jgi:hypothetical protein
VVAQSTQLHTTLPPLHSQMRRHLASLNSTRGRSSLLSPALSRERTPVSPPPPPYLSISLTNPSQVSCYWLATDIQVKKEQNMLIVYKRQIINASHHCFLQISPPEGRELQLQAISQAGLLSPNPISHHVLLSPLPTRDSIDSPLLSPRYSQCGLYLS